MQGQLDDEDARSRGPLVGRRTVVRGGATLAALSTLGMTASRADAVPPRGYDPRQRFTSLVGIGDGQVIGIQANGALVWHRDADWRRVGGRWAEGSGRIIGSGWSHYAVVMGSTDGSLYGVQGDGSIVHRRYSVADAETGAGSWTPLRTIGTGWERYVEVVGFGGDIYGRDVDGWLHWSHYDVETNRWTAQHQPLRHINFKKHCVYADADGVLYGLGTLGDGFRQYRQVNGVWQTGSGRRLRAGLGGNLPMQGLFFTGSGTLYCIRPDPPDRPTVGEAVGFRLTNFRDLTARPRWRHFAGRPVRTGWSVEPHAALQGYASTPSVVAGGVLGVAVSTSFASFSWSVLRLGGAHPEPVPGLEGTARGGIQELRATNFLARGCGWRSTLSIPTPGLDPGLYCVRLGGPYRLTRDIAFVVLPAPTGPRARIAFILPTLTYNAYNSWGGHNQYCRDLDGQQRHLTLARPSRLEKTTPTGHYDNALYADILLLQWMHQQGHAVDVYTDLDLHRSPDALAGYQVVVLGSHPEYWSLTMRQGLSSYLVQGGNLAYAGGNGIFEAVDIHPSENLVTYRVSAAEAKRLSAATHTDISPGDRRYFSFLGYPGSLLLNVAYTGSTSFAPYRVVAASDHPLLRGTGLTTGSSFGARGYNGAASGWETDGIVTDWEPEVLLGEWQSNGILPGWPRWASPSDVIAQGLNRTRSATMTYRPTGHGGYVFSASSISFGGALAGDPAQSRLFANVLDHMLTQTPRVEASWRYTPMTWVDPQGLPGLHDAEI
ncbi:MAG: hypothetical protein NVS3B1_15270 [Marmoricola sp.]